jgi:hypothetical protein
MFHRILLCLTLFAVCIFAPGAGAAEQSIRIGIKIQKTAPNGGTPDSEAIIASPIVTLDNGGSNEVNVGPVDFSIHASLEPDSQVRILTLLRAPYKSQEPIMESVLLKLGEKGRIHLVDYQFELTPTLADPGLTVDFPGGSLQQLFAKLTDNGKNQINVVGDSAYLSTNLPAFSIHNASPFDFAEAMSLLLAGQNVTMSILRAGSAYQPIFILKSKDGESRSAEFACYDLADYLKNNDSPATPPGAEGKKTQRTKPYTVDEIAKIVTDACAFRLGENSANDLRLRFNRDSQLLFISGQPPTVHAARVTLEALPKPGPTP